MPWIQEEECLKKNLNASRPSKHPKKMSKRLVGGIIGCKLLKISKYIWDPAPGGVLEGGGPGGGLSPPGTAAVSKHQTGTVTRLLCDDWGDLLYGYTFSALRQDLRLKSH